jgi:predicted permease
VNRRRFDDELRSEMDFHREMAAREGRTFGDTLRLREESREAWGWTWIDRLAQDLRYAVRTFRRSPGFTLAAVLTLALSVGVNVAAFGFFDLFALRPLPVRDADTILRFQRRSPEAYATHLSYPAVAFYREHSRSLSAVMGLLQMRLAAENEDSPYRAQFVTANYLAELGADAVMGRMLDPATDEAPGTEPVVVLSEGCWRSRFGADPAIVGKTIRLNDQPAAVIGVAAMSFGGLTSGTTDVWLPITQQPSFVPGSRLLIDVSGGGVAMWGRLRPGVAREAAEEELRSLAAELRKLHPHALWEHESLSSEPGAYAINAQGQVSSGTGTPNSRREIYTVAALAGTLSFLILAVACGNLGSLLLARGAAREREIAIRVAVGAGPGRIVRQLFTESVLLALFGSLAGLALGNGAVRILMRVTEAPSWLDASPDWRILLFATGMGFAAAILFGLTPAIQVARRRQGTTAWRHILVGAQVTASCVLRIVASLLVRALEYALHSDPGFEYRQVIAVDPRLGDHGYSTEQARAYLDAFSSRLRAVPGVESVSLASHAPLGRKATVIASEVEGRVAHVHTNHIDPAFFRTMRIPILRGRVPTVGDTDAIVISESLARHHWPGEDPVGRQISLGAQYVVVGVSGNARAMARKDPDAMEAYLPLDTAELASLSVLIKTTVAPEVVLPAVASISKAIDPRLRPDVELMTTAFERSLRSVRGSSVAASLLGFLALLLACLGIVGLVAYAVAQRTQEIGIRMALGAPPSHVLSVVLRQFSRAVAFGLLAGVGAAAALSQLLRRELYGISPLDPMAYLTAITIFIATATIAALVPARRALRVDPLHALRYE